MLKPSLQLKLGQQLTMTPQLQQAIRLLQLPALELQAHIRELLESNVMLEPVEDLEATGTFESLAPMLERGAKAPLTMKPVRGPTARPAVTSAATPPATSKSKSSKTPGRNEAQALRIPRTAARTIGSRTMPTSRVRPCRMT